MCIPIFRQFSTSAAKHASPALVRVDGAEGKVLGRRNGGLGEDVEEGGLTHVRQS